MICIVRFLELGAVLDPGKTPKIDKCAILNDAIRAVTELRSEAEKLKDSNESLQEKIKELKVCTILGSIFGTSVSSYINCSDIRTRFF
jgi:hypothetical protein